MCFIAFGGYLLLSGYALIRGEIPPNSVDGPLRWVYALLQQVGTLGLLWYVLQRSSRRFSDIGLRWERKDIAFAIPLFLAGLVAYTAWSVWTRSVFTLLHLPLFRQQEVAASVFGGGVSAPMLVFLCVNPFFEELIARAYLITETQYLTNNLGLAVLISVVLQMSYHLYQGVLAALSGGILFLVFSLYYAKTRRILAPILAHFLVDVTSAYYYLSHASSWQS